MGNVSTLELKGKIPTGTSFEGVFLLKSVSRRTAKNGRPFLVVEVGDRYGMFSCNIFEDSDAYGLLQGAAVGTILSLAGVAEQFNDRLSPRIQAVRRISPAEARAQGLEGLLYGGPKESSEALRRELEGYVSRIGHEKLKKTVEEALREVGEVFWTGTAAINMHHAYRFGLLEHSVHVARAGIGLLPYYPFVDPDLAIAGLLLHDVGKALEYCGEGAYERTRAGLLQGHVVLGYRIVRKAALTAGLEDDLLLQLEHIILCHQGMPEYGAAVLPSSPEGVFVSLVDNLDAKMAMVERALDSTPPDWEFSEKVMGLEGARVFTQGR
ncbi:MAG: HD domain-containing protein [Puniceicoccales bacterium]|jgi:3'-5' exoribonuclease|nr:HD domain-containing protein [Puniceicoccales bacterium]